MSVSQAIYRKNIRNVQGHGYRPRLSTIQANWSSDRNWAGHGPMLIAYGGRHRSIRVGPSSTLTKHSTFRLAAVSSQAWNGHSNSTLRHDANQHGRSKICLSDPGKAIAHRRRAVAELFRRRTLVLYRHPHYSQSLSCGRAWGSRISIAIPASCGILLAPRANPDFRRDRR